jgi:2-amino-4-hydroxy-6-hydroxymethyldihydropteridine diphosphokinase
MKPHSVYLGLGSNIDARKNIVSAIDSLENQFGRVRLSPVYSCPAVGFEGDDFLNLVAGIETGMSPLELDAFLHELENAHGRDRSAPRWSSRTLDIDILLCDDLWLVSPVLEIPRKEILTAAHVLKPLADLAPDFLHPVARKTFAKLWAEFTEKNTDLKPVAL